METMTTAPEGFKRQTRSQRQKRSIQRMRAELEEETAARKDLDIIVADLLTILEKATAPNVTPRERERYRSIAANLKANLIDGE